MKSCPVKNCPIFKECDQSLEQRKVCQETAKSFNSAEDDVDQIDLDELELAFNIN